METDPGGVTGRSRAPGWLPSEPDPRRAVPGRRAVLLPGFCDPVEVLCAAPSSSACSPSSSLGLVGGTLAFFLAQKAVTVTVDGQARTVGTYADTVGEVLEEEGLEPAAHDVVLPAARQSVDDGDTVVLNRARPLELTVDGVSREVYVTALSVDEALEQLGYRADGLVLSASRSERLPLDGMELIDHHAQGDRRWSPTARSASSRTTAATAGDLLAEQGIALSETDRTSLYLEQALLNRMRLQVFRVQVERGRRVTAAIPYERVETPDPNAFEGDETVTEPGVARRAGHHATASPSPTASRPPARSSSTEVTREPVAEQVTVGTKPRPTQQPRRADGLQLGPRWRSASPAADRTRSTPATATTAALPVLAEHLAVASAAPAARTRPRRDEQIAIGRSCSTQRPAPASGRTAAAPARLIGPS